MREKEIKTAFVTGASRGIGAEIAKVLAQMDMDLYLVCRSSEEKVRELSQELAGAYGVNATFFVGDIGDPEFVADCFAKIEAEGKTVDVLINNAGISYVGLLTDMEIGDWRRIMATNLDALFYTCRLAVPKMVHKQSGKIINISSVWGRVGASMEVAYSTSKGGVDAFTKALAKELAPSNIQVNAISCGLIDTDMNACFSEEDLAAVIEEIPADRMGKAGEVAEMVKQILQSPSYLTGQVITIDGGWQ
ncbi:MAG: SDR family NAD(P)-dependent oxidoreductase [Lachnospiraceae bacterium]|nr:SDR family NAD(P)-dependent oxidoreductase [Lachnospiraceae bacterium]